MKALLVVFVVDALTKVFPTTLPPEAPTGEIFVQCARNEYEAAQIALRLSEPAEVTVTLSALRNETGYTLPPERQMWNFVGTVPIKHNTPVGDPKRLLCRAPCEVPDPLLAERKLRIPAGRTQAVWLTFFVPEEAPAGVYRGAVVIRAGEAKAEIPVKIEVWPFSVPKQRHLAVTNWVNFSAIAASHKVKLWSEDFWKVWDRYLENLSEHRQTIVWVPWRLIEGRREAGGTLSFDYSLFDRFVEALARHGMADRLEIQHVAHPTSGWGSPVRLSTMRVKVLSTGAQETIPVTKLLADLQKHLQEKGWLKGAMVHVCDEPTAANAASWREAARKVHQAAPKLARIDAIETSAVEGELEVWVPKLSHLFNWKERFDRARQRGNEIWYYICCHPYGGHFPNRFLDFPLSMVRLFHWINAAYDLKGYLHWGLNFWNVKKPFGPPRQGLPPGDTNVIYPGPSGPLSSIRWEVQRDSLEDYEYLYVLAERLGEVKRRLGRAADTFDPWRRVRELARMLVRNPAEPVLDPSEIRKVRRRVAEEIIDSLKEPLALVWTYPEEGDTLYEGPCVVEVYGVVKPGAVVEGLGRVAMGKDGRFCATVSVRASSPAITFRVRSSGKVKTITRRFTVRK